MKDIVRVAIIQPKPYPSFDDPRNVGHALQLLEKCRGEELDVICFPEYFPYVGERELGGAARDLKAYLVAGLVEAEGDKLYNTATLFDRFGRIQGRQRKHNVTALERDRLGISGASASFQAFATDFGKIGIPVCVDFWGQPEAGRQLAGQGVEIVFNMAMFPVLRDHWVKAASVRAFDNFMAVVGVNNADYNALVDGKRIHQYGGKSFVIAPPKILIKEDFARWFRSLRGVDDWIQVQMGELEQIHVAQINLTSVRRFRQEFFNRLGVLR